MKYLFVGYGKEKFLKIGKKKIDIDFEPGQELDTDKYEPWIVTGLLSTGKFKPITKKKPKEVNE